MFQLFQLAENVNKLCIWLYMTGRQNENTTEAFSAPQVSPSRWGIKLCELVKQFPNYSKPNIYIFTRLPEKQLKELMSVKLLEVW